ncbi:hypothetical protein MNBD_GAMMA16-1344 [hydrothermal vent metagenome]|uniref:PilZ domain-containing protein n=1 Tax=hydrothermal vent metagenome TaxID=652676 RepID=A0A3B0YZG0_9ZZZZ
MVNHRWGRRHKLASDVRIYIGGEKIADGIVRNISYSGICIDIAKKASPIHGFIDIVLEHNAKNEHDIHVHGMIVRSTKNSIAVMF